MRASSSSLTNLHQAHRNLLKSIAATNQLHCTCSTSITSNRSSSQPSRSTHTTTSNSLTPIPSTSEYNLDFLYPSPRRRLYSTRQGQNGDEEDVSEIPEASTSKLKVAQSTTTRSRKAEEKFLRQRKIRAKKSNLNRMSKIRKQDLLSLISHPLTTENFPIPTRSQAPEMKLLFDHQESIYEAYKKRLDHEHQSSNENSSSVSSASLHFKVARYLLDFAQFIGLNFSRIQLRKAESLRRRIATILLKDVIPQLERISVRRKVEEESLVNPSVSSGKKRAMDSGLESDDVSSFRIECLKVGALMIEGSELEALTLLDSLFDSQNLLEQVEVGARSVKFFSKSETEPQVRDALSSSILTVLSTYKLAAQQPWRERGQGENYTGFFRYKEKRTFQAIESSPESIANSKGQIRTAERALSWFFSRVELCMFNHHSFSEIRQTVGYLVGKLRYPLGFLEDLYEINSSQNIKDKDGAEDSKKRKRLETLHINLTNFTMLLVELDLSLAHQAWKFMHSKGLTLLESATRTLIKAATNSLYQQKVSMIENLNYLALKQSSGSGLEFPTYLLLCKHCATFGDQVGLENQLRQLRLYHREQTSTLEDSIYELRCLASSVSGDSDRLIRLLDQRFNLDSILPFKERASFQKSKQGSSKEEPNQKKSIDASKTALLLRCYVKLGDIESAEEIYDNMKSLNLKISSSTYDSLLSGYSRKVNVPAALSLVDEMRSGGIKLSYTSYHHLIRLFALRKDPESAERVIETMRKEGLDIGMRTHIALLNAYVESGSWNLAISHFEFLERRMKGKEYSRLPKQCYVILLKAYILSSSPIQDVMKIFHTLIQDGFQPDSYAFTLLLQSATDAGAMEIAEKIFSLAEDYLARPEKIQMSGERSLRIDQSGNVFSTSFQDGSSSSEVQGEEESEEAFIPEVDDVDSSSSSLDRYESERVSLPQSRRPILRGQGANVYHFTIMINAYLRLGNAEDAKEYLTEMKQRGIKLTSVTYGSLVASYVKNGTENNAALAKEIISSLKSFEPETSKVVSSQISQSDLDARISLDERIVQTNSNETISWDSTDFETLYSPLLQSYAKSGEVSKAQDVLKDMSQIGIKGGIRTLTSFLDANRRAGDVEACMDIWDTIYSRALAETSFDTNVDPITNASDRDPSRLLDPSRKNLLCLPLSIFMEILQDDDHYKNEIPKIWNQMRKDGFGFDAHNYNSLVRALIKSDRIDSAMRICEDILKDDLFEDAKERKLVELRERKRSREEALSRGEREEEIFDVGEVQDDAEDIEAGNSELDDSEKTPIHQISRRSIPSNRSSQEEEERDYVESPSRPPNRRSQNRFKDDFDGIPPLEDIIKLNQETADSKSDDEVQESGRRNGTTRTTDSTLTSALKNRSHELSQWFPHFQTLKLLESYLDSLDRGGRTVAIASPNHSSAVWNSNQEQEPKSSLQHLTVSDLHRKYPRTAENLRKHRIKVQAIEERYRADAERDQVRAQKEDWRT